MMRLDLSDAFVHLIFWRQVFRAELMIYYVFKSENQICKKEWHKKASQVSEAGERF